AIDLAVHPDLEEEQAYLDRAYEGLEVMREDASRMLQSVLDVGRGGTFQSRTERDIVVRTSLARLAQLDIGDQALLFWRIDRLPENGAPGESFHIGRLAVSGEGHEPLVVDWRAPVAEPFYRATGLDPQGLARRRHLAVRGRTVTGVEDEYFALPGRLQGAHPGANGSVGNGAIGARPVGNGSAGARPDGNAPGGAGAVAEGLSLGGPGALLAALGEERTGQMGDIVATIQREQDEIIRSPLGGVLMVQGGPGTGKTAVALHRAAYLLYTHRFPLERQGVLVVGPNPLFLRYIERVLPSLGETGVTLATAAGLVPEIRVRSVERPAVARLKGDARMARVIARAVRTRQRGLRRDLDVAFGATTLHLQAAEAEQVAAAARRRPGSHNARRRFVEHQVLQRLAEQYERFRRRETADGTGAGEPGERGLELAALRRQIARNAAVAEALDRMWPRLSPHELVHDLFGARPLLAAAGRGILSEAELALLRRPRSASLAGVPWTAADAALVDEARSLLGPRRVRPRQRRTATDRDEHPRDELGSWPAGLGVSPLPSTSANGHVPEDDVRVFGHIVVDEAQDLSPMQLRMLARRSISGSMTVVGDVAQATGPWLSDGWTDVERHLSPARPARVVELSVGYRTPAEVMEVAAGVLAIAAPGLRAPSPMRRSGVVPTALRAAPGEVASRTAQVAAAELAAVGGGRLAVLVPPSLAGEVTRALEAAGLDPVDPRDGAGPGLAAPLVVLPAAESHGLEFDAVVVVEPAAIVHGDDGDDGDDGDEVTDDAGAGGAPVAEQPSTAGYRALYVALTRPTRRLAVVHGADLPEGLVVG
ncbi:MAG: HelD family protein, partial [Acidimicrobiales bacterium]